ncbi:uncharacterized protein LOC132607848 [Lycium barbarum]|uniref:uncharacterized protein LOC132607848 n=1 Tax=Lycium barbarum TaxID=112863 RepID=UPI00293F5425|nr:uncharacterized protein LOC132607848 [Lycium barbarum]
MAPHIDEIPAPAYAPRTVAGPAMTIGDQEPFARFIKIEPPKFIGTPAEDAYEFIVDSHERLYKMGLSDSYGFHQAFLEKYVPCTLRDLSRDDSNNLGQRGMSVPEYEALFLSLARYAVQLIPIEAKRLVPIGSSFQSMVDHAMSVKSAGLRAHSEGSDKSAYQGRLLRDYILDLLTMVVIPVLQHPCHRLGRECPRPRKSRAQQVSRFRTPKTPTPSIIWGGYSSKGGAQTGHGGFQSARGMNGLSLYHVTLDCHAKTITLAMPGILLLEWKGIPNPIPKKIILYLQAEKLVDRGCLAYLAHIRDTRVDTASLESVPVVSDKEEHEKHSRIMLGLLKEKKLYTKFSKCEFWPDFVAFQVHVVCKDAIMVDPKKMEAVRNLARPTSVSEIRSFVGLASYYCRFVKGFSSIALHLT